MTSRSDRAKREPNSNEPSVLDLFAAPGGLSQGFIDAGYQVVATVDNDKWGCETLRRNLGLHGTDVNEMDITNLRIEGQVDVVVGGPPCQSFSTAGRAKISHLTRHNNRKRLVDHERNRLYKHFVRIVGTLRPQFFVMENVWGLLSYRQGRVADEVREDFEKIGYESDLVKLNAADFGVPQIRKRAVFVGNRIHADNPVLEKRHFDPSKEHALQAKLDDHISRPAPYRTVRDAISDLPSLEPGEGNDETAYPPVSVLTSYQKWARESSLRLYNHVARRHSERDRQVFRRLNQGETMADLPEAFLEEVELRYRTDIFKDKIRKQSWDRPSTVILAHMQKDGLMYVHPDGKQARTFTPREAARIQSFQDRYRFMGPMTQQFKQIGNAVPPLLAWAIASAIKPHLRPSKRAALNFYRT